MGQAVPTLDTSGWVRSVEHKADRVLSYFLIMNYSQTYAHYGKISSLPYLVHKNPKNFGELRVDIRNALEKMLSQYFDSNRVSVNIDPIIENEKETSKMDIRIIASVTENGKTFSLGRLVHTVDGKVRRITPLTVV